MRPSFILRATEYRPMIKFIGQRHKIEHAPHAPAPHPCAPQEIAETFQSFLAKLQSQSSGSDQSAPSKPKGQSLSDSAKGQPTPSGQYQSSGGAGAAGGGKPADFENFWEAPSYLWTPKGLSEREVEAVMSGGATDIRTGP